MKHLVIIGILALTMLMVGCAGIGNLSNSLTEKELSSINDFQTNYNNNKIKNVVLTGNVLNPEISEMEVLGNEQYYIVKFVDGKIDSLTINYGWKYDKDPKPFSKNMVKLVSMNPDSLIIEATKTFQNYWEEFNENINNETKTEIYINGKDQLKKSKYKNSVKMFSLPLTFWGDDEGIQRILIYDYNTSRSYDFNDVIVSDDEVSSLYLDLLKSKIELEMEKVFNEINAQTEIESGYYSDLSITLSDKLSYSMFIGWSDNFVIKKIVGKTSYWYNYENIETVPIILVKRYKEIRQENIKKITDNIAYIHCQTLILDFGFKKQNIEGSNWRSKVKIKREYEKFLSVSVEYDKNKINWNEYQGEDIPEMLQKFGERIFSETKESLKKNFIENK